MGKSQPKARQIKLTPQRNPTTKEKKRTATTLLPHANVKFSAQNLTLWLPFYQPSAHLAAKIRFSRRLVVMQKGVSL